MSFVFKEFLASFPLFFIFSISRLSPRAATFPPFLALGWFPAPAQDNVSTKRCTILGYHEGPGVDK